jgi:kinesin family protein 2/24
MNACQKLVAAEIFADRSVEKVQVQCLELVGKKCHDLIMMNNQKPSIVEIRDNPDGSVDFVNAATTFARYPREILSSLVAAQKNRTTHSTEVNDVSSRSHAVYQLRIFRTNRPTSVLTLLDCAGTERRHDSLYHSQERQSESTEINASLYALKECIRIRSQNSKTTKKHIHVPYRSSNLTRILRESLECPDALLHVIATVSPNATDTEHTIHTLKTISTLTGSSWEERDSHQWISTWRDQPGTESPQLKAPKKMSHLELVQWLAQRNLLGKSNVPEHIDGKSVMKMSKIQLKYLFYDDGSSLSGDEKAELLFKSLRSETEKIAQDEYKRRMQHVNSQ